MYEADAADKETLAGIFEETKLETVYHLAANSDIQAAICGYSGGKIKKLAKYNIYANIDNMQITEDIHLILDHMMMYILSGMKGC